MSKLKTYSEVIKYLDENNRVKHLLLGNGFSMAYDPGIFSYNALNSFIDELDDELLSKLFDIINTKNFELVMQQLSNFSEIAEVFGTDPLLVKKINTAGNHLKKSLIDAIKELHPEHVFKIPEDKSEACFSFLSDYLNAPSNIFSTNYDILLYWVLMRNKGKIAIDGFGRDVEETDEYVPEDELEFSELRWGKHKGSQNIHYLHGTLPVFDTGVEVIKAQYESGIFLLENIKTRIDRKQYPIFVAVGTADEKLTHIKHNQYLSFCYDKLCNIEGSLVTFGFNFGEYDTHLISAINKAAKFSSERRKSKLFSIYIGIYSDTDKEHILSIKNQFKCKVNLFDAKTTPIWNTKYEE